MKLNDASKIYAGAASVAAVYAGANKVWPSYPAIIKTAAVWIDATQDSFTNGQNVTSYTSHSNGARVFTTALGTSPVFRSNVGGKPRLDFIDGAGLKSAPDYQPTAAGITYVQVIRRIIASQYGMMWVYNSGAEGYEMRYEATNLRTQLVGDYSMGGPVISTTLLEPLGQDILHWSEFSTSPARCRCWINGVLDLTGTMITTMSRPLSNLWIGCRTDGYYLTSMVSEGMVFGGILSDADRLAVTDYLMAKWSVSPLMATQLPVSGSGNPSGEWMP